MAAPKGNQFGRKSKDWEQALRRALHNYECDGEEPVERGEALQKIARQCVKQALAGDRDARQEIANRLDGKPTEHVVGEYTHFLATDMSDEQLADIAAGSRNRAAEAQTSAAQPSELH